MGILLDIDRQLLLWLNGSDSLFMDGVMATLTAGTTWIPLYLALFYLILKNNETMAQVMLTVGCAVVCVLITAGITNLVVKPLVARPRPCNDLFIKYMVDVVQGISSGVLPLIAYNYASGDRKRMNDTVSFSIRLGLILSAAFFILIELGGLSSSASLLRIRKRLLTVRHLRDCAVLRCRLSISNSC